MKSTLLKRSLIAGAVVATSVATYIPMISAASADTVLTAAGSDTTENVMGNILSQTLPSGTTAYNIPVYSTTDVTVPGDAYCPTTTFTRTIGATPIPSPVAPGIAIPNGSGAGRDALKNYIANVKKYTAGVEVASSDAGYASAIGVKGCVDIARSSSYSSSSPGTGGEFYAFALDAVTWATTSQLAPSTLTPADLLKIFNCTYTDWSEVGGSAGPIQRYLPPDTSGTKSFFQSDVLGTFDATTKGPSDNANCPAVKRIDKNGDPFEENRGDKIPSADFQKAIFPYSAGQWVYQANNAANPTIDQRQVPGSGFYARLGGINNATTGSKLNNANDVAWNTVDSKWQLNDAGLSVVQSGAVGGYPVVEGNTTKYTSGATYATVANRGIRYVYNVISTNSPSYDAAAAVVGFDNSSGGAKSPLCSGTYLTNIASYGFSPLPSSVNANFNIAGSTCRKFI